MPSALPNLPDLPAISGAQGVVGAPQIPSQPTYTGPFAPEKRAFDKGVMGGIAMMAIAAVWFFVGLKAGWIFYYPPILFVIGLAAFFKGLLTGNLAGKN